jgi:plastocyanin
MMSWGIRALIVSAVCAAHLTAVAPAAAQGTSEVQVEIALFQYMPNPVVVPAGTTITWVNTDAVAHNVTADDRAWESGLFSRGESFAWTFDAPGVFGYYCVPHGSPGIGMIGVVEVVDPMAEVLPPAEEAPPTD